MANFQPLNTNQHQSIKVKTDPSYAHSAKSHIVPVSVFELPQVQAEYPIVFIKDGDTGRFHLVALLGLKPQENLYHKVDGWQALYIPQALANYPFVLSASPEQADNFIVGLDMDSTSIVAEAGESLFGENGEQSEFLKQKTQGLVSANAQLAATQKFVQAMTDNNLLSPQSLTIKPNDADEFNVTGLYTINETAFNELTESDYQALKTQGVIGAIYSCLFSMQRIAKLVQLKNER